MAFTLIEGDTYEWPVTVQVPRKGKHVPVKFTATFKLVEQPEIEAAMRDADRDESMDQRLLDTALCGWDGFNDVDGDPIEYTDENRRQALDTTFIRVGLVSAFFESMSGDKGAKAKNW